MPADFSEPERAEEALRKSEERYRRLVETTDTGYVILAGNGTVLDANQAYVRLSGHDRLDELLGRSVVEWTAAEEREKNALAVAACMKDGFVRNLEITYVDRTGRRTPVEINATTVETEGRETILSLCRDISDRKRAEEALRESEARYRALIDSSPDAITQTGLNGTILMCNRQTALLHGYEGPEDLIGRSAFELFAPDELQHANLDMQRTLKEGVVRNCEYRFVRKDGSQFEAELSATVIRDAEGTPSSFMALTRDIGERKRMERALRESEERFSRLAQASFEGVAVHEQGLILDANQAMADLFGYELSEFIGMNLLNLAMPESRELIRNRLREGVLGPYEAAGRRKDGTAFVGEINSKPMPYQGRMARVTAIRDITERKRAEAAIAAEKERLAVTLRSIGDGVITTDTRGAIVIMNRVAEELTGWTQGEAEGKPLGTVFTIVSEMTREPCENPVAEVLATGAITELANYALLTSRDGSERVIADSGAPITDRDGKTIGVVLVFRDMTEKQKTMDAIQRAARLDSLGVLAGGIAHDFNNLLTGLFGYVELARSVSKDARAIEYLEATMATMNRARALTLQLLTFAKGGAPAQKITPLVPFIQEAVQFALSGANVACRFSLGEDVWPCNIDKNQIAQVIDNIVINAQQAMPNGGFIEIAARNVSADEGEYPSLSKGQYVRVSIKDQGIGIPKDVMPRIFDPFYTTKTKGHGLGLATCYSIIRRHGGCIDVESEPGKGSAFHVYLPASTEAAAVNAATIIRQKGSGTVIVVDDEEVVRNTVRRMVEALGFTVVCKGDGGEAIDFYVRESKAGQRFVAMILDLTIRGGMGGKETVAEIRKLNKELPVFVASGYADDPVMRNPVEYGFTGSIGKPFTIAELSDMLKGGSKD
jgi:PAS domain S-box-containing protein